MLFKGTDIYGSLDFNKEAELLDKIELLYEEYFNLTNIEKDFLPVFERFYSNEKLRTCPITGEVMEVDERFVKKNG